jgi:predicted RNA-binding protein
MRVGIVFCDDALGPVRETDVLGSGKEFRGVCQVRRLEWSVRDLADRVVNIFFCDLVKEVENG